MRLFAVLLAICALSQTATAQTPNCKSIAEPDARLSCYDAATSTATSAQKPAAAKPAISASPKTPASKVDGEKYVDSISEEDALMSARLKSICRGC
jgi:hypothetical protein